MSRREGGERRKLDRERSIHRLIRPAKSELFFSSSLFSRERVSSRRLETIFGYFFTIGWYKEWVSTGEVTGTK